ncbi:hypothetical protein [Flavobacterium sp.]|uniref:hypothetical protein n=1 Tax=Flavobacterium sp. TaxID=239 RepID=UPI00286DC06A|nr:hypothetical protein [Flavobacterium sp.]
MKYFQKLYVVIVLSLFSTTYAQVDSIYVGESNIQTYTPSKLLEKGKLDIKWFNNLYTQTRAEDDGEIVDVDRSNYFTTSLEIFTGVSESKKLNAGLILEFRSNTFGGKSAGSVFGFNNQLGESRSRFTHIAPSIKIAPFESLTNFSIQSSFFIPLHKQESDSKFAFLAAKSFIWQNRFFYDYTFTGSKFQLFSELGTRFFFGKKSKNPDGSSNPEGGYANNSVELAPGVFLSYFPSNKFTVLTFLQHAQLIEISNKFSQNYTATGLGAKYQLSQTLNIETIYSKFIRGNDSGLGQSFNLGIRAIF